MQTPGLKVVIPSNPYDAKGLLASAIADPDPVLFLENIKLYRSFRQETPEEHYAIPLGKANIVQEGGDVSIFAYGAMVNVALEAAKLAQQEMGISIEIIDLRTIWPLDEETIYSSVRKTNRCVVVDEAWPYASVGSHIGWLIQRNCFDDLDAPVDLVAAEDVPMPYNHSLELAAQPSKEKIVAAVKKALYID